MTGEIDSPRLRRALDEIAEEGVQAAADLWPAVSAAVTKRRGLPRMRRAWAVPALAIVALVSVAAVTAGPRMIDELDSLLTANRGVGADFGAPIELGLEQTMDGVTVKFESVRVTTIEGAEGVIQEGQLSLVYTVHGLPERENGQIIRFEGTPSLKDRLGRDLPVLVGLGTDSTSEIFAGEVEPGVVKGVYAFDLWGTPLDGDVLRLKLELPLLQFHNVDDSAPEVQMDEHRNVIGLTASRVETQEIGRFEFDFTVPVTVVPGEVRQAPGQSHDPQALPPTPQVK